MEIEAKFDLTDDEAETTLSTAAQLGPYQLGPSETLHLTDQYLDTKQRDCFRQGYECRLRTSERGVVVTLKALDHAEDSKQPAVFRREEIEQTLPVLTYDPTHWPQGPAQSLVEQLRQGRPLVPELILLQQRLERRLFDGDRQIALLTVDHVWPEIAGHEHQDYSVLEVELDGQGTEEDLRRAIEALQSLPGLRPASCSKFERALTTTPEEAAAPPARRSGRLSSNQPMAVAGAIVMAHHWHDATRREAAVRDGKDPEAIHDMRVAVRRLRAAFALFADWYPKKEIRGFKVAFQRLGRRLGDVRDLEVLLADARAFAPQLADAELNGLLARWEEAHATARVRLLSHLDGPGFRRFAHRFEEFLDRAGQQTEPAQSDGAEVSRTGRRSAIGPSLVRDVIPAVIWKRYGAVHAYAPFVGDATLEQLHGLRIAGKRLRYLLESFEELLGKPAGKLIEPLKQMQDTLGTLHDAHVAIGLLEAFQAEQAGRSDNVQPYLEHQRSVLVESRARFELLWPAITAPTMRRRLAAAAATL